MKPLFKIPTRPKTRRGDVWELGSHRLMCGDSASREDVARLMDGERADLCFTSPPYDQQRDYDEASDVSDWLGLMQGVFSVASRFANPDAQILVNLGLIHRNGEVVQYYGPFIQWMRVGLDLRFFAHYVWDQGSGMPGANQGRLMQAHEFVYHFNRQMRQVTRCSRSSSLRRSSGHGLAWSTSPSRDPGRPSSPPSRRGSAAGPWRSRLRIVMLQFLAG